uniref:Uncharacterized protein n=1 Tax=Anguilla anguilla TaxID=7936 RepID=A0A0E9PWR7_ANGAN
MTMSNGNDIGCWNCAASCWNCPTGL